VYGVDAEFIVHAGLYAATVALPRGRDAGREMFLLRTPGRVVALHPCQGNPLAYFVYWIHVAGRVRGSDKLRHSPA
jgi:hypothetical protein